MAIVSDVVARIVGNLVGMVGQNNLIIRFYPGYLLDRIPNPHLRLSPFSLECGVVNWTLIYIDLSREEELSLNEVNKRMRASRIRAGVF